MTEATVPRWFWIVALLALIWNALGAISYLQHVTMTPEAISVLPAEEQALYESMPRWATGAYAIGVWAGLIASALLLLRRSVAPIVYAVSLAGILVQMIHSFFMSEALEVYGPQSVILPGFIVLFAALLVWHARRCDVRGWLR